MIVSFNTDIFTTEVKSEQEDIAEILKAISNSDTHFIDISNINTIFYINGSYIFDDNPISFFFLSLNDRTKIKIFIENVMQKSAYLTNLHKKHLTKITIGKLEGQFLPQQAKRILIERPKVIVENGINDWKFIRGICEKYTNHKKRKSIYELIKKAIKDDFLEPDHSGGHGEIVKIVKKWVENPRYHDIYKIKLIAIFDSDKSSQNNYITPYKDKVEFFKNRTIQGDLQPNELKYESNDIIIWHILHKRKLENYVPLNILFKQITSISENQKNNLLQKQPLELDFIEYNLSNVSIGESKIKDQFPEIFLSSFSFAELENRCDHHKETIEFSNGETEEISEIEIILLKIAKII